MNNSRSIMAVSLFLGIVAFMGVLTLAPVDSPQRRTPSPSSPGLSQLIGSIRTALVEDRILGAVNLAENAVTLHPERADAWMWLGITAERNGDPTTAMDAGRVQLELLGEPDRVPDAPVSGWTAVSDRLYRSAWAHRLVGEEERARSLFAQAGDALEREAGIHATQFSEYNLACYRALAGEHDRAADHFARAVDNGYRFDNGWWDADPDLDPIREHPVFRRAAERLRERLEEHGSRTGPDPEASDGGESTAEG